MHEADVVAVGAWVSEHKKTIGGAAIGLACAGPLGAVVGVGIGTGCEAEARGRGQQVQVIGVGVAAAGWLIAGLIPAVGAGLVASGGAYFANLPRQEKYEAIRGAADAVAGRASAALSMACRAAGQLESIVQSLSAPRIGHHDAVADTGVDRRELDAKVLSALKSDGFALRPLDSVADRQEWRTLEHLVEPSKPGEQLGRGKDVRRPYGAYDSLRLASAWRIEHPRIDGRYRAARASVLESMEILEARGALRRGAPFKGLPARTQSLAGALPLMGGVNETLLLHGTSPDALLSVLSNGLNERLSGTSAGNAFGDGIYFAEDIGKVDQYTAVDRTFDPSSELHRRLFADSASAHPGHVFYVLVCRVVLGFPARTAEPGRSSKHLDTKLPLFPVSTRELSSVPGVTPPTPYHSLIAELGGTLARYREFVVFHGEYCCPVYLMAYQRCRNGAVVNR